MVDQSWKWTHATKIPSDTAVARELLNQLLLKLEEFGWDEQETFGIHLALEEALVNAIKHGNRLDPNKEVEVDVRISNTHFKISIADEGDGFIPEDVPDPTAQENLESPSGRGIMLMRSFMSTVSFNDVGNRVDLSKERNSSESELI
ncbi:MAG: ATP-binding protein [Pirellulaceae bacterium]|nr:ATP-binding protein [Pirellulaceae bacterium]